GSVAGEPPARGNVTVRVDNGGPVGAEVETQRAASTNQNEARARPGRLLDHVVGVGRGVERSVDQRLALGAPFPGHDLHAEATFAIRRLEDQSLIRAVPERGTCDHDRAKNQQTPEAHGRTSRQKKRTPALRPKTRLAQYGVNEAQPATRYPRRVKSP